MVLLSMEDACTVVVSNTPATGVLTSTGFDGATTALLAVGLLITGLLVVVAVYRHRRNGMAGGLLAVLLAVFVLGGSAIPSAQATPTATKTNTCSLLDVTDLQINQGSTTATLQPGEASHALRFTMNNPADFDIEVTVATRVINNTSTASGFVARLLAGSTASTLVATGNLDAVPTTVALRIPAGSQLVLTYAISVRANAGNEMQGAVVHFESLISAREV